MRAYFLTTLLSLTLFVETLSAQWLLPGVRGFSGSTFDLTYGYRTRNLVIGVNMGRTNLLLGGFGWDPFWTPPPPPLIAPGWYGYPQLWPSLPFPVQSTTIFVQPPIIQVLPPAAALPIGRDPSQPVDLPEPEPDPKRFLIIRPERDRNDGVARIPAAPIPKVVPPVKEVELGVPPRELAIAEQPCVNPRAEADRLILLGRQAFALGETGRAMIRFQQAVSADPGLPTAWFLLAQAQFARGKYQAAVQSIIEGLRLFPEWPMSGFRPDELYGVHRDSLQEQLRLLREVATERPGDPRLAFLLGVQLWFTGQRGEARTCFERAKATSSDPTPIDRFLR